ncbi:unnamed protein product [Durusdinium trenchii]|uniref:Rab-GAP TBC domain-containing protein n=1 Tax=Durusdinium trenchii TaxID=1381693 RepID=A0ABP0HD93_9DINO
MIASQTPTNESELWTRDVGARRRSRTWRVLLLDGLNTKVSFDFSISLQAPCPYDAVIRHDLARTLPSEELFREKDGKGQQSLFRILRALAVHLWDIGYVQSLNFVVATLIVVLAEEPEDVVFRCAQALLFRHSLADFYRPRFPKLGVTVWQFDRIVEAFLPDVHAVLQVNGVTAEYYAMQWFLTLFASDLPQRAVHRIWDRFLVAGWQVIVQVGLALLKQIADVLQSLDACETLTFLKKFVRMRRFEPEVLLADAQQFEVSHRMLSELEAAYNWQSEDLEPKLVLWWEGEKLCWEVKRVQSGQKHQGVETGRRAGEKTGQANLLPFLLHNLDTGETSVLEEEWNTYLDERKAPDDPGPDALSQCKLEVAPRPGPPTGVGGSHWLAGRQREALRALGKVGLLWRKMATWRRGLANGLAVSPAVASRSLGLSLTFDVCTVASLFKWPVLAELPSGELPDIDCLDADAPEQRSERSGIGRVPRQGRCVVRLCRALRRHGVVLLYHAWEFDAHWQAPRPAVLAQSDGLDLDCHGAAAKGGLQRKGGRGGPSSQAQTSLRLAGEDNLNFDWIKRRDSRDRRKLNRHDYDFNSSIFKPILLHRFSRQWQSRRCRMASKEVGADTPGQRAAKKSSKGAQAKEDELKKKEKKQKESKHKDNKENKENREKKEKKEKDKKEHKGKREKNKAKKDKKRKHNLEKDPDTLATGEDELDRLGDGADGSGDEEANLWDSIGAELPEKAVVETPAAATAGVATVSVATPDPTAEAQTVKGDYVIQVDAELRQTMAEKVKIIEHIVEGTQLVLEAGALQIFGPPEAQTQANHCANAVLKNRVHEGCADVSTVHVLPEWVDAWDGQKALEEELNVLIVFERLSGRGAFPLGQLAGLPWVKWSRTGEEIELYQPVVVRKFSPGGGKVKVTWCWDGLLRDEDASKLQAAVRVHIIGKLRDRGEALLRVLTLADQKAVGLMACQMETLTRRSDICGCDGGPGGMGLQEFDLGFDQRSLKRFWGNNGSELVDLVTKVSRCVTLSVYERPTAVSESYSRGSKQHIIALGTRKQRWMAAELLRMIVYTTIEKWLGRVPAKLGGECCLLTLPGQALTQFFGYRQRHYRDLMHETNTIIVPVQQNKGGIEKKDIDEVEDFIANMMEADDPFEIAIFGEPLAQSIVLVKLYALVERKVPGFVIRSGQSEEQIDPSDGVGIDKIRLTFDFQEDATNKKAEILSEAAGCYAACIGNLLLLAGHLKNRQRAREYAQFLAPKQRTTGGKFPYVHDVDVRADMMATWVPEDASKSKWFKDRLKSLMEEMGGVFWRER